MSVVNSYDLLPYDSAPVPETHPDQLAALGMLRGLTPAPLEGCRVLELGCAEGGNLIPLAHHLPTARLVGVDLSRRQIELGRELASTLGLTNLELRQGDLAELEGAALGEFDYVIAHGLFSWVPPPLQERILELCAAVLAPHGIACVSYNTLPGWHARGMVRDYLRVHTREVEAMAGRLAVARNALELLDQSLKGRGDPVAKLLQGEVERLARVPDSYLFHEYLEEHNHPLLLLDFVAAASRHHLAYLGEADLGSHFPDLTHPRLYAALAAFVDPLAREQQADFLVNRVFRQSLLCRAERNPAPLPDLAGLGGLAWWGELFPMGGAMELRRSRPQPYQTRDGRRFDLAHPLTRAAVGHLARVHPAAVAFGELAAVAQGEVGLAGGGELARQEEHLRAELSSLAVLGAVGLAAAPRGAAPADLELPCVDPLIRELVRRGAGHLPTPRHRVMAADPVLSLLVPLLDGTRTMAEAALRLEELVREQPALWPALGLKGKVAPAALTRRVGEECRRWVGVLARQGMLAAGG